MEDMETVQRASSADASEQTQLRVGPHSFTRLSLIGVGDDCARVYLARLNGTERHFALKVLPKADMLRLNKVKRAMTEVEILRTVHHPFVVTLYWSFSSCSCLYYVMEFCAGGPFYKMLRGQEGGCLPEENAVFYAAEVLLAIEYLHMVGFMYRDLKPENILLSATGHIVLTGFEMGKSTPIDRPQSPSLHVFRKHPLSRSKSIATEPHVMYRALANSFVGTDEYVAPEIIAGSGHTSSVDWWTFGVFIYEMLYGVTPFRGQSRIETFSQILEAGLEFPSHPRHSVSRAAKSLMRELLDPDGETRLGAQHGACEIKSHAFFRDIDMNLIRNMTPPWVPQLDGPYDLKYCTPMEDDGTIDRLEAEDQVNTPSVTPGDSPSPTSPALLVDDDVFAKFNTAPPPAEIARALSTGVAPGTPGLPSSAPRKNMKMSVTFDMSSPSTPAPMPHTSPQPLGLLAMQLAEVDAASPERASFKRSLVL